MSIIIEIEDDEVFMLYHYYHEACFPHWKGGDIHKVESVSERHKCWECQEWIEAKQEMQALNGGVDPLALSTEAYEAWIDKVAWKAFVGDDIDPRKQEMRAMVEGVCPCGVEGCRGLDWMLDGNEPY